jgi:hypothetical protein
MPEDRYAKYDNFDPPGLGVDLAAAYRKWHEKRVENLMVDKSAIQSGGNLRQNTPRKEKHHRLFISGVRAK